MHNILTNIALANAIFEEKQNYIDTYYPFLLKTFESNEIASLKIISDQIASIFDFELPIHSIKDILKRKEPDVFQIKKSSKSDWSISLTESGKKELVDLGKRETELETELSEFYHSFLEWTKMDSSSPYNSDDIKELVESFLKKNLVDISIRNDQELDKLKKINGFEKDFVLFLAHIKNTSSQLVKTFDHLWKGTVLWNELIKEDQEKESLELPKNLTVYVDTNFVFSLLGFHNPIINQAALELHSLLSEVPNVNLFILDNTLYEIFHLLDFYTKVKDDFYDIEVDSIFYYLKAQRYTHAKIEKLKDDLRGNLSNNFSIQFVEGSILTEKKQQWLGTIYDHLFKIRTRINEGRFKKKSEYAIEKNTDHDASVITHVLGQKDRFATRLENSKAIFLTSSFWLFYNYKKIHKEFESTSSVIFDATLTNILYLKNPKKGSQIAIDQIIKSHSNYLIINNNIWAQYISEAKELLKNESIDLEDYSRLVSKNQYSEQLLLENDPDDINPTKVLEVLKVIKEKEEYKEEKIKIIESELGAKTNEVDNKNQEIDGLTKRVQDLEKDKALKDAQDEFNKELGIYNNDKLISMQKAWESFLKTHRKTRNRYLFFIVFSLVMIFVALYLKMNQTEISSQINWSLANIIWATIIIGIIVFFIPFVRSFFKHDQVLKSFNLIFSKAEIKSEFETSFEKEYEKENVKPVLKE
jgi:hypothetical protein